MEFNKKLKKLREEKGLSQAELAKMAGVSQTTICDVEIGNKMPKLDTAMKICKALNVKLMDVVEG